MAEFKTKPKAAPQQSTLSVQRKAVQKPSIDPHRIQRQQARQSVETLTNLHLQRKKTVVQPVLKAQQLRRDIEQDHQNQQEQLQEQQGQILQAHTPQSLETALEREKSYVLPERSPLQPQSNAEWVTVMRMQAAQAEGRQMLSREAEQFIALQRQVTHTLIQRFKADRQPAAARYSEYAEHLATLQREPLSGHVSTVFMGFMPQSERPALQRAVDEAVQRQQDNTQAAQAALNLQSIQRQLAELKEQSTLPVLERIQQRRGAGNPLPEAIQRHLEQGLNHDLSGVRIHDDAEADKLSKRVNAVAFTTGTDIYFQSGKFNPNTQSGLELLAHEATHVVQQSRGQVGKGIDPDSGLETAARESGKRLSLKTPVQAVKPLPLQKLSPSRTGAVQRKPATPPSWNNTVSKEALSKLVKSDMNALLRHLVGNTYLDQTFYSSANRNNPKATPEQGKIFLDSLDHLALSAEEKKAVIQAAIYKGTLPAQLRIDIAKAAVLAKRTDPTAAKNLINTLNAKMNKKGQVEGFGDAIGQRLVETVESVFGLAQFAYKNSTFRMHIDPVGYQVDQAKTAQTVTATYEAIKSNPRLVWDAMTQDVRDNWQKGEKGKALGFATFDLASVAAGGAGAAPKMRVVVQISKDASGRIVTKVVQVGDDIARGMGAGKLNPALATVGGPVKEAKPPAQVAGMAQHNKKPLAPALGAASTAGQTASNAQPAATTATAERRRAGGNPPPDPYAEEAVKQFGKLPSNWVDVKSLLGKPFEPSTLPGPYTLSGGKTTRVSINIPAGKKGLTPLMVDMEGNLQLRTNSRLSIASKMRANYIEEFGEIPDGHWLHHLIPDNIIKNHPLGKILLKYGYDLDDVRNLIAMADKEKYAELVKDNPNIIGHWSNHKEYDRIVKEKLDDILREMQKSGVDLDNLNVNSINSLKSKVKKLEDDLRELIKSGNAPKDPGTGRLSMIETSGDFA